MKKIIQNIILVLLLSTACTQSEDKETVRTDLENNVMEIHDEAMSKMGSVYHLRRDLRALRDTFEQKGVDTVHITSLQQCIKKLNEADEAMKNWMRQYSAPTNLSNEHAVTYLQNELKKMERVHALLNTSIEAAQESYDSLRNTNTLLTYE